jgi:predicted transport protein
MIGSKATVQLADELLGIAREIDPSLEPKYNKHYIGLWKGGQPFNFCAFRPRKSTVNLEVKMPRRETPMNRLDQKCEANCSNIALAVIERRNAR